MVEPEGRDRCRRPRSYSHSERQVGPDVLERLQQKSQLIRAEMGGGEPDSSLGVGSRLLRPEDLYPNLPWLCVECVQIRQIFPSN